MKQFFLGILLKITSSSCKMKSKVTFGIKNTAHYTHSLYILLTVMGIFNTNLFVASLIITTIKILFIKYSMSVVSTIHFGGLEYWLKWMYMKVIWRLNFFTHMDLGKLSAGYLLLKNVLPQHQTFYALSQLQQQPLGKCIISQTLTLSKLWKNMKTINCNSVHIKL